MVVRIDRYQVKMARDVCIPIGDTLSFVEDGEFLAEFTECGLTDDDLQRLQTVITVSPNSGEVVPVSRNIRDICYCWDGGEPIFIRYVHLEPTNTVLLLSAYLGDESHPLLPQEAEEAEAYIAEQLELFRSGYRT